MTYQIPAAWFHRYLGFLLCISFFALVYCPVLFASDLSNLPPTPTSPGKSFFVRPWAVGQSVKLQTQVFNNGSLVKTTMATYSIVDQETVKGQKYFWVEIETDNPDGNVDLRKIQVRQPQTIDFENVFGSNHEVLKPRRMIEGFIPAGTNKLKSREIPIRSEAISLIENGTAPSETKDWSRFFTTNSGETVDVPAGSFVTTRYFHVFQPLVAIVVGKSVTQFTNAWGSPDIPIWGLVKKNHQQWDKRAQKVTLSQTELLSYGEAGAVSKINTVSARSSISTLTPSNVTKQSTKTTSNSKKKQSP